VEFLHSLKSDPGQIIVAGITGLPNPVQIYSNYDGEPGLAPSCSSADGEADPAIRLNQLFNAFPRHDSSSICLEDKSNIITNVTKLIQETMTSKCIEGNLSDIDEDTDGIQPKCNVHDVSYTYQGKIEKTKLHACNGSISSIPCYRFETNVQQCFGTATNLNLIVERGGASLPLGVSVTANCTVSK
jgi:hypothetical protein